MTTRAGLRVGWIRTFQPTEGDLNVSHTREPGRAARHRANMLSEPSTLSVVREESR